MDNKIGFLESFETRISWSEFLTYWENWNYENGSWSVISQIWVSYFLVGMEMDPLESIFWNKEDSSNWIVYSHQSMIWMYLYTFTDRSVFLLIKVWKNLNHRSINRRFRSELSRSVQTIGLEKRRTLWSERGLVWREMLHTLSSIHYLIHYIFVGLALGSKKNT